MLNITDPQRQPVFGNKLKLLRANCKDTGTSTSIYSDSSSLSNLHIHLHFQTYSFIFTLSRRPDQNVFSTQIARNTKLYSILIAFNGTGITWNLQIANIIPKLHVLKELIFNFRKSIGRYMRFLVWNFQYTLHPLSHHVNTTFFSFRATHHLRKVFYFQ